MYGVCRINPGYEKLYGFASTENLHKPIPDSLRVLDQSQGFIVPTWLKRYIPEHCFG
jgi:hypothetical protein